MGNTKIKIIGENFYINDKLTYSEIANVNQGALGLLMNARFIQGIFDEQINPKYYNRFGKTFNSEKNTDDLISALPMWYNMGLRAITVGLQGGGPCFTTNNNDVTNNPYSHDGLNIDKAYLNRMTKLINAADNLGMIVIINAFYVGQIRHLKDSNAVVNALTSVCLYIKENNFTNVMLDIANEQNLPEFYSHPIIRDPQCMAYLINLAKSLCNVYVSSSFSGGVYKEEICQAADFILIHGNGCSNQSLNNLIDASRKCCEIKPVVINEDSQEISNMEVAFKKHVSWGYYNNLTKQEPPANWNITDGEDRFFAEKMALLIGIKEKTDLEDLYYLQGAKKTEITDGKMWLRVASLYPKAIKYVEFFIDDLYIGTAYDSPFMLNQQWNWLASSIESKDFNKVTAKIYLSDETIIIRERISEVK